MRFAVTLVPLLSLVTPIAAQSGATELRLDPLFEFSVGGGAAHAITFSPDGSRFATGGYQGDLVLWDTKTRKKLWSRKAGDAWVGTIRFSPDGHRVAAMAGSLTIWLTKSGRKVHQRVAGGPHGLAWSRDG